MERSKLQGQQILCLMIINDCKEQEYKDRFGNCRPCRQCEAGYELSKECGFGYGEDAQCVPCRSSRFKEDRSVQKCKPCLDCGLINRFQKDNCSSTSNAMCGDCLPGYYRKTKLSGFQDMECIPCGSGRVNLVPLPPMATSPRDMALAAVICSALATVLLALLVLCTIYCKRQLLEKKPSAPPLCSQDFPYSGAELSCLDPRWLHELHHRPCCQCHLGPERPAGKSSQPRTGHWRERGYRYFCLYTSAKTQTISIHYVGHGGRQSGPFSSTFN
uniref:Tumor necrosis factor receptor superfamily, member 19 n=1 Tax=Neogobius melanostomus TaxID=47308 RepID=A0A8C6UBH8_9GOBI